MYIEENIESTRQDFIVKLNSEIKNFNSRNYFPLSLKKRNGCLIITTDSILTRGVNSFFKINIQEERAFLKIKGKLKMSIFGRVFSVLLIPELLVALFNLKKDDKSIILLFVFLVLLYGKYYYERMVFKKFLINFFEDFVKRSTVEIPGRFLN